MEIQLVGSFICTTDSPLIQVLVFNTSYVDRAADRLLVVHWKLK